MKLKLLTAVILAFAACTTAALAQNMTGSAEVFPGGGPVAATAAATASGMYVSSITFGNPTNGAPCYGGNTGCGAPAGSIAIPYPLLYINHSAKYNLIAQFQSTTYAGPLTVKAYLVQGGKVIASGTVTFSSPFGAGYVGYAYFTVTAPATTGALTVAIETLNGSTPLGVSYANFVVQ